MSKKKYKERVWIRKSDAQIGYVALNTFLGAIWFFAEHSDKEVLNTSFCNFIDDPRDKDSHATTDFIDVGVL